MKWVIKVAVYLVAYLLVHFIAEACFRDNAERVKIGNAVAWGFCAGTIVEAFLWAIDAAMKGE